MSEIPVDYVFSDAETRTLVSRLLEIKVSPYADYVGFRKEVRRVIEERSAIPDRFLDTCFHKKYVDPYADPYFLMRGCPVDPDLPYLDLESPVVDKRARKKTFVAEGFLELYARLMDQEPVGYFNANDGDIFMDVHPMRKLMDTQSMKSAKTIYFHKDTANHAVRADWVNLLGLRSSAENEIYTSFVSNKLLLEALHPEVLTALRRPEFYTPYDVVLTLGKKDLGRAPDHPVLGGTEDYELRFFENRTEGITERAKEAIAELVRTLHALKRCVLILTGDFVGTANNECIHNREVVRVGDQAAVENRWLMKTLNVRYLDAHKQHMCPGEIRIVNG